MGAVGVKTLSFCCLDHRPDGRDLLGIEDTTCILELRNLILVEPFPGGESVSLPVAPAAPPVGVMAWLNCNMSVPMVGDSIWDNTRNCDELPGELPMSS